MDRMAAWEKIIKASRASGIPCGLARQNSGACTDFTSVVSEVLRGEARQWMAEQVGSMIW